TFTPASLSYTNVVANQSARDYTAAGVTIAGTVRLGGAPLAGAALSGGVGTACTSSDAAGQYVCTVPQGWSGTLSITASGYGFLPALRAYVDAQVNLTGEDFAAAIYGVNATYYVQVDHLNITRAISNGSGISVWRWDQTEPFGDSVPNQDPSGTGSFQFNLRFAGQYSDQDNGLSYNYFRYYDPTTGRYRQSDPIGLRAGMSTYAYVRGRPTSSVDPLGLWNIVIGGGATGVVGVSGTPASAQYDYQSGAYVSDSGQIGAFSTVGAGVGGNVITNDGSETGGNYGGFFAGVGASIGVVFGDTANIEGRSQNIYVQPPILPGIQMSYSPTGQWQGIGISFGPGIGAGMTQTNTRIFPANSDIQQCKGK
ncbi:MAG TPA: RHS repeat-associated core domain-containing protein, partial [Burkholderiales bacterium]|nr:RHS repeat-associated core domain-containing protein [Burkholderiales bacterium]